MIRVLLLSLILSVTNIGFAGTGELAEYERLEFEQQQIIRSLSIEEDGKSLRPKEAPSLPFPFVDTHEMHTLTTGGIVDLTWDGQYLWGIDGAIYDDVHYIVKISPSDFQILEHFAAPNDSKVGHGARGIAFGNGYLWVTNTYDDKIYAVDPATKAVDPEKTIDVPVRYRVISGGCFDGNYLWIMSWDPLTLYRANITTKEIEEQFILSDYDTGYDLTYLVGYFWITASKTVNASELEFENLFLKVNPTTGAVVGEYDKVSSVDGVTFTGSHLITSNGYNKYYDIYEAEDSEPPSPTFDGTGIQITGTSSNITMNVLAGDSVEFTIHTVVMDKALVEYRFFTRAGYGEPDWGGNKWQIVQPYSSNNTVMHTFDTPGIYFLVGHVVHPGDTWVFGYPQSGIVVEVWPTQ